MADTEIRETGGRSSKSKAAYRVISQVAEELEVMPHVLRFWETKFPQVRPLKRGGGRRYYRSEDVALLRRIRDHLYTDGYTIKGVQRLLRCGSAKTKGSPTPIDLENNERGSVSPRDDELGNPVDRERPDIEMVMKELEYLKALLRKALNDKEQV